ncbi:MAG: polyphosphate polymerase domain-containing protein [Bacillus sp. (in: Bacteria)]|nr:polyphosphate polymerase domain-containing protein [Bacillus sp. (in: firmicutes)]
MKKFRHEYKYYITQADYEILSKKLSVLLKKDQNSTSENGYLIRSLYFDNLSDTDLLQKNNGVFRRKKFRIRIYNHLSDIIKLEKKSRQGEYILKTSVPITLHEYELLQRWEYEFLLEKKGDLYQEFYAYLQGEYMRPRVIVDYIRDAYIANVSDVRITFDKELSVITNSIDIFDKNNSSEEVLTYPLMIMEVKFNEFLPTYIRQIIQMDAHTRSAISKYVLCRMDSIQYHGI